MGNALAKEYMRQLRQEMEERKGKQLARGEELANIELYEHQSDLPQTTQMFQQPGNPHSLSTLQPSTQLSNSNIFIFN